eukprot:TRINITY_DN3815_c0_g1_i2.p1 TRINITY_DN3815_c0_g1~~TRINITY_DN3815_c0_g1_i2.p1  ORF type:complete len:140 (-),score=25.13 TRINITY_DN3815_c0_g1_i2:259-678(-)
MHHRLFSADPGLARRLTGEDSCLRQMTARTGDILHVNCAYVPRVVWGREDLQQGVGEDENGDVADESDDVAMEDADVEEEKRREPKCTRRHFVVMEFRDGHVAKVEDVWMKVERGRGDDKVTVCSRTERDLGMEEQTPG